MLPRYPRIVPPDADHLLRLLAGNIDDAMLREIASADYGRDVEKHLGYLRPLRDRGVIPTPLAWEPREVLELIRWSEPDDPEWGPGGHGQRGHQMRAFACTALLRAEFDPQNIGSLDGGQNQTLAALITSLLALGSGLERPAAGLVEWVIDCMFNDLIDPTRSQGERKLRPWAEEAAFFGAGLLSLAVDLGPSIPDPAIVELCAWVSAHEALHNRQQAEDYGLSPGRWLLSTTYYNLNHSKWRTIGDRLLASDLAGRSAEAGDWVRLIGSLLAND